MRLATKSGIWEPLNYKSSETYLGNLVSRCSFCVFWDLFSQCFVRKLCFFFKINVRFRISVKSRVDPYMMWIIPRKNFFFEKSLYSPSGMVWSKKIIFSITQPFLNGSFSSSNPTYIFMKQICAQNFSSIEYNCEELSKKNVFLKNLKKKSLYSPSGMVW